MQHSRGDEGLEIIRLRRNRRLSRSVNRQIIDARQRRRVDRPAVQREWSLFGADVHGVRSAAARAAPVAESTTQPPVARFALAGLGGLPDGHAFEVRSVRIRITHGVYHRKAPVLVQLVSAAHRWMKPELLVEPEHIAFGHTQCRPTLRVAIVGVGDDHVQAVVAAFELNDDEYTTGGLALGRRGESRNESGDEWRKREER